MSALEEQIEERKRQAEERQIFAKAKAVTLYLGSCRRNEELRFNDQISDYVYRGENLEINTSFNFPRYRNGELIYCSEDLDETLITLAQIRISESRLTTVFQGSIYGFTAAKERTIFSYTPGKWEEKLDALYSRAQEIVAAKNAEKLTSERQLQSKEEAELRKRFGL